MKNQYRHEPGMNPNRRNFTRRKRFGPKVPEHPEPDYNYVETVEPLERPIPIPQERVTVAKRPGTEIIGKIHLRPRFIQELQAIFETRLFAMRNIVKVREQYPVLAHYPEFCVYYAMAWQAQQTMRKLYVGQGPYALNEIVFQDIFVPEYLVAFINAIGSFETPEGTISVFNLENQSLRWLEHALTILDPGRAPIPLGTVWNVINLREQFEAVGKLVDPLLTRDFIIPVPGMLNERFPFDPESMTPVQLDDLLATGIAHPSQNIVPYIRIIDLDDYDQAVLDPDFNNLYVDGEVILPLQQYNRQIRDLVGRANLELAPSLHELGVKTTLFSPTDDGTPAQTVRLKPLDPRHISVYADVESEYDYNITPSDSAIGLVLSACERSTFEPTYVAASGDSRQRLFDKYVNIFDSSST
jgi:hypothetical protein